MSRHVGTRREAAAPRLAAIDPSRSIAAFFLLAVMSLSAGIGAAAASTFTSPPIFAEMEAAGALPPIAQRLPEVPRVVDPPGTEPGRHGGQIRMLMNKADDTRQIVTYGYARLVGYDQNFELVPDILEAVEVFEERVYTLRLRQGMKWSDGAPFTARDFRYWWENIANNLDLFPVGPPVELAVNGQMPWVEYPDPYTVIYAWNQPNPEFLPALARASPLFIFAPAHYLEQFHEDFAPRAELRARLKEHRQRNWASLHNNQSKQYRLQNVDLPTLNPWLLTTELPSNRIVFRRNPYFHRVDRNGFQLPYADEIVVNLSDAKLIASKTGSGDSDLQARYLRFEDYTFLRTQQARHDFTVNLWRTARGAHLALYPNLNVEDPVWRALFRDVRFRRALSLAINRFEINQVVYYGLAMEGNNTVLPKSPLYKPEYQTSWASFDLDKANALLDEIGLVARNDDGIRLLPDGRPLAIIVETQDTTTEQSDVLELIRDSWLSAGIKLYTKPLQREVFRNRIFAGETQVAIWFGMENGLPTSDMSPWELAPTSQQQLQWPKWGQYLETGGKAGEPVDMEPARELLALNEAWRTANGRSERAAIWQRMLRIHEEQVYTIGLIAGVLQPVVVSNRLRNVPQDGIWNWDPGAHFGIYHPDLFWISETNRQEAAK